MCPRCGSSADVHTARELFDMMNGAQEQAFQRFSQFRQPGAAPGQWQGAAGSPVSEIKMPVTLAQADAIVARLR